MITGTHILLYSDNPEADRTFFRDILKFPAVDAGGGWLIFGMPPAETGIHPVEEGESREQSHGGRKLLGAAIYLMCDDLPGEIKKLEAQGIECSPAETANWGSKTTIRLPSGGEIGLYQPTHPVAVGRK